MKLSSLIVASILYILEFFIIKTNRNKITATKCKTTIWAMRNALPFLICNLSEQIFPWWYSVDPKSASWEVITDV